MSISSKMTGTVWHTEKMTRQEDDVRRHKSRCIHLERDSGRCEIICDKCGGSAHCDYYKEKTLLDIDKEIAIHKAQQTELVREFSGVKMIPMDLIYVREKQYSIPKRSKIVKMKNHYETYGHFDKPIIVSCFNGKYLLEDRYLRYYVAKLLGLKEIQAEMGNSEDGKNENILRTVGKKIYHKKFGDGVISNVFEDKIIVTFESGDVHSLNVVACYQNKLLTIIG